MAINRHFFSAIRLALILTSCIPVTNSLAESTKSVILIIGDGMDDHQITIARNYLAGSRGTLLLDEMPFRGVAQVLTIDEVSGLPVYVADSANTATALATGQVTSRGRIATSAGQDLDLPTIVEIASRKGYRTGLVTTSSITDATPASFAAHVSSRYCESPAAMIDIVKYGIELGSCVDDLKVNGGLGSISEQLAKSNVHLLLGGGRQYFTANSEVSQNTAMQLAAENGFNIINSWKEIDYLNPDDRILGLFAEEHLPVKLKGEADRSAEAPKKSMLNRINNYFGEVTLPSPMSCIANSNFAGTPTLKEMSEMAIKRLSYENRDGFFLMIESASIDKQSHERKPCGSVGELDQLIDAVSVALEYAKENPDTLILVTSDHTHAAQIVPDKSLFSEYPVPVHTPGKIARIFTKEGGVLAINYATSNFEAEEHTGANVPIFGNKVAVSEKLPTYMLQSDVFSFMARYLGLN